MAKTKAAAEQAAPTHERVGQEGVFVRAVRWVKDGDHPDVVRYPIEGRAFKGLLVNGPKDKHALKFGDWILDDKDGRRWVVDANQFQVDYVEIK